MKKILIGAMVIELAFDAAFLLSGKAEPTIFDLMNRSETIETEVPAEEAITETILVEEIQTEHVIYENVTTRDNADIQSR